MAESPSCPRGAQGLHRNKPVRNGLGHGLRVSSQVLMDTWDCGQSHARQHPPTLPSPLGLTSHGATPSTHAQAQSWGGTRATVEGPCCAKALG